MKVYKNYEQIIEKMKKYGYINNSVLISNSGLPDEEIINNLADYGKDKLKYLTTIIAKKEKIE